MKIFFSGTEIPGHRKFLAEQQIENVSLSYVGLRRRTKFSKPWLVETNYPEFQNVFLDSGAYTVNKSPEDYSQGELDDIYTGYLRFIEQNIAHLSIVTEFDSLALGRDWIEAQREDYFDDLPDDVFMPIWHADWGLSYLDDLCQTYKRVGVPKTALNGRSIHQHLNSLVQKYGTKLHGIAMTKPEQMSAVKWDSVASTSWISPSQYGDTIVWTGNELKRYPMQYKDQARKRHRTLFINNGFDFEKIEEDDTNEILKVSVWSWKQLEDHISRHKGELVTTMSKQDSSENAENEGTLVDMSAENMRNNVSTSIARIDRETMPIPVMDLIPHTEKYMDGGEEKERDVPIFQARSKSLRMCDSCFLATKCPGFQEGANCAYDIPIQITTKDQMKALYDGLITIQTQRVMFMKMAEDLEGGYADPNLSKEIDRLTKLIEQKHEMEREGFSVLFEAKGSASGGVISRLFGSQIGDQAKALPTSVHADRIIEETHIIDAEIE